MKARKTRKTRTTRKAVSLHSGRTARPAKKSGWRRKLFPGLLHSLVAPLLVGLVLQGLKGCDRTSPRILRPAASAALAAEPRGGPASVSTSHAAEDQVIPRRANP